MQEEKIEWIAFPANRWIPPREYQTPAMLSVLIGKDHLLPYLRNVPLEGLGGWWDTLKDWVTESAGDVWDWMGEHKAWVIPAGATAIAFAVSEKARENWGWILGSLGVYSLAYGLYKYQGKEREIPKNGAEEPPKPKIETVENFAPTAASETRWYRDLVTLGAEVVTGIIIGNVAGEATREGVPESRVYEKTMAYVTRYATELASMGFESPEQAASAILYATDGRQPDPEMDPWKLLGIEKGRTITTLEGGLVTLSAGVKPPVVPWVEWAKSYWWVGLMGLGLAVIKRKW